MNLRTAAARCRTRLFAAAVALTLSACSLAPGPGIERLDHARLADGASITLPVSWTRTGLPAQTRLTFAFDPGEVTDSIAVYVTRTTLTFRASVNGRFVYESGDAASTPISITGHRATPHFRIARELLHAGANELVLELAVPARSHFKELGILFVGDADDIEALAFRRWLAFHAGPMAIGVILFAVGLVSLGLWAGRRDRDLFMLLAAGSLLWALQIILYQWPTPLLPGVHWGLFTLSMYMWWPVLLGVFFLRFAYRRSLGLERFAAALVVVSAPLLYAGYAGGWVAMASIGLRLCVLVFIGFGLVAILRYALELRTWTGYALFAAGLLGVGVAIFDFVRSLGVSADRVLILNPYSGLSIILFTGWMLLERYHRAYAEFEMLNRDLEQRVDAANAELHRRLEQVEAARATAEQANVAKSRFFAAASHDLRQPLHSLGLFASALRETVTHREGRELVQRIGDSIGALDRLFDELLDLSRLDAGTVEVRPRNVALQDLFDRLAQEFFAEAAAKELRLRFHPTPLAVHTDPLLLERVLANLVSNAIRYTQHGGVLVGARRRGGRVVVQVCDSGIGIAADQRELIFDEFYQVSNPGRDRRRGLGLGLAIVRRLTSLLDVPLALRSEPGRGSCFTLELPPAAGPIAAPGPTEAADQSMTFAGRRALIVDDDADICAATVSLLARWGFEARAAPGAAAARGAVDGGFVPDVILADLRLGEASDGIDVVEGLRRQCGWPVAALLISGDTGARELVRVRQSGLLLLTKPVAPARLRSALHALLIARN